VKRPGTIAGVVALALLAYITYNSIVTEGPGSRGVEAGRELPAFAVPLALSELEGDADMSCDERGKDIVNVCELAEHGPVVLAFFAEPISRCVDQIDVLDRLRPRFPDVQFAAVATLGDRRELRERIRDRRWDLPVGHDRDGAVANAYAVAVCPQITFARRGGEVVKTTFGSQDAQQLTDVIEAL
jgi:AhpC/TSA family